VHDVLAERNRFVQILLDLFEQRIPIARDTLRDYTQLEDHDLDLWISIMQSENVLKPVPGQPDLYSLFRTHHTVSLVAGETPGK